VNLFIYDLECKGGCNGLHTYITSLQAYRTWATRPAHWGKESANTPIRNMSFLQKKIVAFFVSKSVDHTTLIWSILNFYLMWPTTIIMIVVTYTLK
jgi:hypothetical protein